jgi:hypothetical protein
VDNNNFVACAIFECGGPLSVDILTDEHMSGYGKFSGEPNEVQLARYFH